MTLVDNFQYCSDLHIDINHTIPIDNFIIPSSKNLILAGDISQSNSERLNPFIEWCSQNFEVVIYVLGNHEYYESSIELTQECMLNMCEQYDNVRLLINNCIEFENCIVIGTTLWSRLDRYFINNVRHNFSDFKWIKKFKIQNYIKLHNESVKWLSIKLNEEKDKKKKIIIVSHHAPYTIGVSDPIYKKSYCSSAFCTDLSHLFKHVDYWIFGHTHYCVDLEIKNMKLLSNQFGYLSQGEGYSYDREKILSFYKKENREMRCCYLPYGDMVLSQKLPN